MDSKNSTTVKDVEEENKIIVKDPGSSATSSTTERVEALLKEAQDFEDQYNFPEALKKANEAITINASSVDALLMAASATVSMGECDEEARILYQKAIDLEPDKGYDKYFGLAQISKKNEAIELYKTGLKILKTEFEMLKRQHTELLLDPRTNNMKDQLIESFLEDSNKICLKISTIYAAMVEVYLCDMNNEEGSLEEALKLLKEGLKENPESSELWLLLTSILVSSKTLFVFKNVSYDAFNASKLMIKYLLIRSKSSEGPEDSLIDNLEKAAQLCMTLNQFRLAKLALEEFKLWLGSDSSKVLGNFALMHRLRAEYHLSGAHYYANLAIDFIKGREKACEIEEDDVAYKKFSEDLIKITPMKLEPLKDIHFSNDDEKEKGDDIKEKKGKKENGNSDAKPSTSNDNMKEQTSNEVDKEENDEEFEESDIDEAEGCRDFEENEKAIYADEGHGSKASRSQGAHCASCECPDQRRGKRRVRSDSDSSSQDSSSRRRPRLDNEQEPDSDSNSEQFEDNGEENSDSASSEDEADNTVIENEKDSDDEEGGVSGDEPEDKGDN